MVRVELSNGKCFDADPDVSILEAARNYGVALEHSCRSGRCGVCKAPVMAGDTKILKSEESLTASEAKAGLILTCCRSAVSDVTLDIADLGRLGCITARTLPCRITEIAQVASTVVKVVLRLPPNITFTYLPGQYIDIIHNGTRRSYSIANAPRPDGMLELYIRQVDNGVMSAYWFGSAKVNDLLRFEGPFGTFFLREVSSQHLIFLATGTGIAPVKAMLEEISATPEPEFPQKISVYWGNRNADDFYWRPECKGLDIQFHQIFSGNLDEWTGRRGHVQAALLDDGIDLSKVIVYACGSKAMIHSAEQALTEQGLEAKYFHSDAFVSSN